MTAQQAGGENVCAFLDTLAASEIGPKMLALSDDGYNVLVGSMPNKMLLMRDYSDHPNVYNQATNSTAAGRYQILYRYWPHYKALLKLPDFGPISQDLYAIQQFREQRALDDIKAGRFASAIAKCRNIWASLPGAGYGQHEHNIDHLLAAFVKAGGKVA
ncbi:glycoside hydrolase family 24 protein [Pseudomonas duriflava]|uniref:glycoside hydrolase family 24 protein n=1 Tax=Pseudomonas duriflava TaxID=459528 RepID=UPI001ABF6EA1|nr:glycoside hydrolase family 104 protein [Pseudomonas duriflava]